MSPVKFLRLKIGEIVHPRTGEFVCVRMYATDTPPETAGVFLEKWHRGNEVGLPGHGSAADELPRLTLVEERLHSMSLTGSGKTMYTEFFFEGFVQLSANPEEGLGFDEIPEGLPSQMTAEEQKEAESYALALRQEEEEHSEEIAIYDSHIGMSMKQRLAEMPPLDAYSDENAISYDAQKFDWDMNKNKNLRFRIIDIRLMNKPNQTTGKLTPTMTVFMQDRNDQIYHDSKTIFVDKCQKIAQFNDFPFPVSVCYFGKKSMINSVHHVHSFEVKLLRTVIPQ